MKEANGGFEVADQMPEKPAFQDFYRQYYRLVCSHFRRKGCSPEDVHDLCQETFLRACRNYDAYENQAIKAWIMTIAANVWLNKIRKDNSDKNKGLTFSLTDEAVAANEPDVDEVGPESKVISKQLGREFAKAMVQLPPKMREVFVLRYGHDLSYKEIAELTKANINTVKSHLSQAKDKMKDLLGNHINRRDQ